MLRRAVLGLMLAVSMAAAQEPLGKRVASLSRTTRVRVTLWDSAAAPLVGKVSKVFGDSVAILDPMKLRPTKVALDDIAAVDTSYGQPISAARRAIGGALVGVIAGAAGAGLPYAGEVIAEPAMNAASNAADAAARRQASSEFWRPIYVARLRNQ